MSACHIDRVIGVLYWKLVVPSSKVHREVLGKGLESHAIAILINLTSFSLFKSFPFLPTLSSFECFGSGLIPASFLDRDYGNR